MKQASMSRQSLALSRSFSFAQVSKLKADSQKKSGMELEIRECGLELFSNFDFLFSASDFPGGKI